MVHFYLKINSGSLYSPENPKAAILIAPATGIKRYFYNSFAQYLYENQYAVLTFDNRGIGDSKGDNINDFNPSIVNWGKYDMTAALEKLKRLYPNLKYHLVVHSAGGQIFGLMDNANDLSSIFNFACSSGSTHNFNGLFKLGSLYFMKYYIPINNFLFGHTKTNLKGLGEPLPKDVARQWSDWCLGKGYVKVHLNQIQQDYNFNSVDMNALWVHAIDDKIANYDNVKEMTEVFPNTQSEILTVDPKEYGFKNIGHMSFFSKKKSKLWPMALEWFSKN